MSKVDAFEVVVRSIGLLIFLRGTAGVFHVALLRSGIAKWNAKSSPLAYLYWITAYLVTGVFLMFLGRRNCTNVWSLNRIEVPLSELRHKSDF